MQSTNLREDVPGLDGPDYVALVIEWDDQEDAETLVETERPATSPRRTSRRRKIAAVVGALGALVLAAWGIRRLRTA